MDRIGATGIQRFDEDCFKQIIDHFKYNRKVINMAKWKVSSFNFDELKLPFYNFIALQQAITLLKRLVNDFAGKSVILRVVKIKKKKLTFLRSFFSLMLLLSFAVNFIETGDCGGNPIALADLSFFAAKKWKKTGRYHHKQSSLEYLFIFIMLKLGSIWLKNKNQLTVEMKKNEK